MGTVKAVCVSDVKGVQKENVGSAIVQENFGIVGDAHAGAWHRQVSLLSFESIEDFKARGADVTDGSFGENLIVEGIDVKTLPVGSKLACNDILLEITQIGKQCHSHCAIYHTMGDCIMPREGVFAKVLAGGTVRSGDAIEVCG
ncbi:MOSC domain-containing protein [Raoultibacter phocaeensis]|uniref:MOSC domain-containing protein n=1 Tax=Raoultibacter phocaeensis TaxID=2479841 RepID=UPI00111B646F|nr:MOSC domain-containing protein [Raoultibacter phocaeensis]